jgi:signal transduction histidine kinase
MAGCSITQASTPTTKPAPETVQNPDAGHKRLNEVRELTRGALAEMRTLLFELRPAALADAELGDLLHHLANSITGRARIAVSTIIEGQCSLPVETKIGLYRIAQEALNNVAKHSGASSAAVKLSCQPGRVELSVKDNGQGFDLSCVQAESLGLGIMRERARAIGVALDIKSKINESTEVIALWQALRKEVK